MTKPTHKTLLATLCCVLSVGSCGGPTTPTTCDDCALGTMRCVDGQMSTCEGSADCTSWSDPVACPRGQSCGSGGCAPTDTQCDACTPSQSRCIDGQESTCGGTEACPQWIEPVDCPDGEYCAVGECEPRSLLVCDPCTGGQSRCVDSQVSVCGGTEECPLWAEPVDCPDGEACLIGECEPQEHCASCTVDETRCVDGLVSSCLGPLSCTSWGEPERCPGEEICHVAACQPCQSCHEAATRCQDGQVQRCVRDLSGCTLWAVEMDCPEVAPCGEDRGNLVCLVEDFVHENAIELPIPVDECESLVWGDGWFNCAHSASTGRVRELALMRFGETGDLFAGDPMRLTNTDGADSAPCTPYTHQRPSMVWNGTELTVAWDTIGNDKCSGIPLDGIAVSPGLALRGGSDFANMPIDGGADAKLLALDEGYLLVHRQPGHGGGLSLLDSDGAVATQTTEIWEEVSFAFDGTDVAISWKNEGVLYAAILDTATLAPSTEPVILDTEATDNDHAGGQSIAGHDGQFYISWTFRSVSRGQGVYSAVMDSAGELVHGPDLTLAYRASASIVAAPDGSLGLCVLRVVPSGRSATGHMAVFHHLDETGVPTGEPTYLMGDTGWNFSVSQCAASESHFAMCAQAEIDGRVHCLTEPIR